MGTKLILVEWNDASSDGGWRPFQNDLPLARCVTSGFLQFDEPDRIIVAQSKSSSGNYADRVTIPKPSIRRIRVLKVGGNNANR